VSDLVDALEHVEARAKEGSVTGTEGIFDGLLADVCKSLK